MDRESKEQHEKKVTITPLEEEKAIAKCDPLLIRDLVDEDVLIVLESHQLNILGQTFRPIFTGRIIEVTFGFITLTNVIIKMPNAPFYEFPTPLSFPIERIVGVTRFDPRTVIPLT
ncbi:hypothetical protein [Alkalihalobacterium bogoriense]|uniref:hypothetical protein n=1 Tax=Alkalihalobacterium bogoriense TaxID=246272 RepID=UPI000AF4016D|nr:hypothetical protein [Alkalihalobacterium bogoriense]